MISETARRFSSMTPAWSLPRSSSRFPRIPAWLGFVVFGFVVLCLIIRQLTQPEGYYGDVVPIVTSATDGNGNSKSLSSWNPVSWVPGSIFGSVATEPKPNRYLSPDREVKIVITSAMNTHDEVAAPLIAAFGSVPGVNLTAILISQMDRFGAFEMFKNLKVDSPRPIPDPVHYQDNIEWLLQNPPDILVCATCNYDLWDQYQPLFDNTQMHVFCVVHHSEKWKDWHLSSYERRYAQWVAADRLDFVTLSPHVTKQMIPAVSYWKELKYKTILPPIRTFPPVFAVDVPDLTSEGPDEISFGIQGKYEVERRNYTRTFEELNQMKSVLEQDDDQDLEASLKLHMVGSGDRPPVPNEVSDMVVFDEQLNFTDFYVVLSKMNAMLPAFADEDYFVHKASSSIPAALIAGAPLVASPQLLATYSYLEEDAVWIQRENQSDLDIIWEIIRKPRWEREQKMRHARMFGAKLALQAKQKAAEWVNDVVKRRVEREEWFKDVVEEQQQQQQKEKVPEVAVQEGELEKEKEKEKQKERRF